MNEDDGGLFHGWHMNKGTKFKSNREDSCPDGRRILSVRLQMDHALSLRTQHQRLRFPSAVLEEWLFHQLGKRCLCVRCFEPLSTALALPQVTAQSPTQEVPLEPSRAASPQNCDGSSLPSAVEEEWPSPQYDEEHDR